MSSPSSSGPRQRTVALCYVRQSFTRREADMESPERQQTNIQKLCRRYGWEPEWYVDAEGHRSGTSEDNRPGWQALKKRIADPDVVAVIANDQARLHRNVAGISTLVQLLVDNGVQLHYAATGIRQDIESPVGRTCVEMGGVVDAHYSRYVSAASCDSIRHRKSQNITVGIPPFGTVRRADGYLMPTPHGAWLLVDGRFLPGMFDQEPPVEDAIWRGYYNCAGQILSRYAEGNIGMERLAYQLNDEGWAFRDRWCKPRPIKREDVRRVIANWPEYGGIVTDKRSKDRAAYEKRYVDELTLDPERAVFNVDLLRTIGETRHQRSIDPVDRGVRNDARTYPLSRVVRCAHCERLAEFHNNPRLHTRLSGTTIKIQRYRHSSGVKCGSQARSVPAHILEEHFLKLVQSLAVKPELLEQMTALAARQSDAPLPDVDNPVLARKRHIERCQRKLRNIRTLFAEAHIDVDEFRQRIEDTQRELAYWESYQAESERVALELSQCIDALDQIVRLWSRATPEQRQHMVRNLFSYLTYDLDKQQFVDFRLQPWADRFLVLRMALNEDNSEDIRPQNQHAPDSQSLKRDMPPRGFEPGAFRMGRTVEKLLKLLYPGAPSFIYVHGTKAERNAEIIRRYRNGETLEKLALVFGISFQRVQQIVKNG